MFIRNEIVSPPFAYAIKASCGELLPYVIPVLERWHDSNFCVK